MKNLLKNLLVVLFLLICSFLFCCEKDHPPTITLILPKVQSPLFYNGDTMFVKVQLIDKVMLIRAEIRLRNQNDSIIHQKMFALNSNQAIINDTFVFHVSDHSNFVMKISAENNKGLVSELPVFIHVMP